MTLALTTTPAPTDPLQASLAALARHALDMLDRLRAAIAGTPSNHPAPPKTLTANPARARNSFDKDPVGKILKRLCATIGIQPTDPGHPTALIAITETPKDYGNRVIRDRLEKILARARRTLRTALPCDVPEAIHGPD